MKNNKNLSPSLIISLFFALLTWLIFYPGILSVDSLYTFQEASTGRISDIRSPFITMLLSLLLKTGGTIGTLTLLQTLSGFLGLRRLILAVTGFFSAEKIEHEWVGCTVIILLYSPLTPLQVYFATFWFDTWLVILLLWVAALLLELAVETNPIISRRDYYKIFLLIILMVFVMLARPNSPILYPALATIFLGVLRNKFISSRALLFLVLCPLMLYPLLVTFQYRVIGVKREHPERVAFALDLGSMLIYEPAICQTLSLPSCRIVLENFPPEFIVGHGAIDHTLNQGLGRSEPGFVELFTGPSLKQDLLLAASRYPGIYSKVKILNFLDYICPRDQYYYQSFIQPNSFGLSFDPRFEFVRNKLFLLLHKVYRHPLLKYFSFVHLTWIIGNLIGIFFFLTIGRKLHQYKLFAMVLSIPAVYYFSYLLAMTASDFRFMYPSLLITQVIIMTLVFQYLVSKNVFIALSAIVDRWRDIARRRSTEAIRRA
jgi:hypothetical protein